LIAFHHDAAFAFRNHCTVPDRACHFYKWEKSFTPATGNFAARMRPPYESQM
jgi:hypothetical protein